MKLIIDMDEVIVDLMGPVLDTFNRRYGRILTRKDITTWELPEAMCEIFKEAGFFLFLKPFPGAIEGIRELAGRGHDIILATAPSGSARIARDKMLWMDAWMPEMIDNLYIAQRKDRIIGDLICDDRPKYLMEFNGLRVAMDRPWNRDLKFKHEGRVEDIPGLIRFIALVEDLYEVKQGGARKCRQFMKS